VDSDFSASELRSLGIEEKHLCHRVYLGAALPVNIADTYAIARESPGFCLELYTSGSTGLPKLVRHRLGSLTRTLRVGARHGDDVWALAYNPTHIAGIQVLFQAFFNGNTLVDVFGLSRDEIYERLREQAVTHISATPTFYRLLLPANAPVPTLRSLTLGGERADHALLAKLESAFPMARKHNLYASTEAGTLLVSDGEAFCIHPALEGKVIVRDGELWVAKELLAEFDGVSCEDWYSTGDRVEIVSESPLRFHIIGRGNDFINVGGAKVDPAEVESIIRIFPGITEVRVFGRPNSVVGTILCAEYSASAPVAESDLRLHLATRLQPHKIPRMMKKVDIIATTRSGKVSRNA
jgi:acyl-coenzyme A synthetase/AMP-(fatty) acid ligase